MTWKQKILAGSATAVLFSSPSPELVAQEAANGAPIVLAQASDALPEVRIEQRQAPRRRAAAPRRRAEPVRARPVQARRSRPAPVQARAPQPSPAEIAQQQAEAAAAAQAAEQAAFAQAWKTTGNPRPNQVIGNLPPSYPGGQVAVGSRVGFLGNRSVFETPFSVTSYTDEQKRNQQARTIGDLLDNNPSFFNLVSRSTGQEFFFSRGFVVTPDAVAFNGFYGLTSTTRIGSIDGIERIEVFRGANALLNGISPNRQAVGGSINLVPKRAPDQDLTRFTTRYGSDSIIGGHWDVARRAGPNKEWGVRVNASRDQGDMPLEFGREKISNATAGLDYRGKRFRAEADFGYEDTQFDGLQAFAFPGSPGFQFPDAPASGRNINQRWSRVDVGNMFGAVRAELDLTQNFTVSAGYGRSSGDNLSLNSFPTLLDELGNSSNSRSFFEGDVAQETYDVALRGKFRTGPISHAVSAIISEVDYRADSNPVFNAGPNFLSNIYDPVFVPRPNLPPLGTRLSSLRNFRGYAVADTLGVFDDRVLLTLGARLQQIELDNFSTSTGALTSSYDDQAVTPAYGLVVKPLKNVSVYGNYIEGLQDGGVAPVFAANAGEILPPRITEQKEVGVKVDFGRLGSSLSVFDITQPSAFIDPVTNIFAANGLQRNRGVELELFGELAPRLRVLGGAAFIEGILEETVNPAFDGNVAPGVPETRVTMGLEWDTPFMRGLTLTGDMLYTSFQFLDEQNTKTIPDWTRFDIGARYAFDAYGTPIVLRANILNVADNNYWESGRPLFVSLGAPRTYLVSAQFDF